MLEHLPKVPDLRLAAVQDANPGLAAQVAERFASPWHGERFEDLLVAPSVDAVVISTPNALHVPQAQAALRAGKPVLVPEAAGHLGRGRPRHRRPGHALGQVLFVDYSYRLLETAEALRAALPEIGSVRAVSAAFHNIHGPRAGRDWFIDPNLSGGGALIDLGVHMLDMVLWLLGPREARLERATLDRRPGLQVEHSAHMEVQLDEVPVTLDVSWDAPLPLTEINVVVDGARGQAALGQRGRQLYPLSNAAERAGADRPRDGPAREHPARLRRRAGQRVRAAYGHPGLRPAGSRLRAGLVRLRRSRSPASERRAPPAVA